jgi:hypothetical protein
MHLIILASKVGHMYRLWENMAEPRMASSGMLRHVALIRTDVSEDLSASIIRVTRIGELGTLACVGRLLWLKFLVHLFLSP